jgi:hypothetical protein
VIDRGGACARCRSIWRVVVKGQEAFGVGQPVAAGVEPVACGTVGALDEVTGTGEVGRGDSQGAQRWDDVQLDLVGVGADVVDEPLLGEEAQCLQRSGER